MKPQIYIIRISRCCLLINNGLSIKYCVLLFSEIWIIPQGCVIGPTLFILKKKLIETAALHIMIYVFFSLLIYFFFFSFPSLSESSIDHLYLPDIYFILRSRYPFMIHWFLFFCLNVQKWVWGERFLYNMLYTYNTSLVAKCFNRFNG